MRRKYKDNKIACAMVYLIYLEKGKEAAFEFADKVFGETKGSNWALEKKLLLTAKGGWKTDWLTNMYRDINNVLKKYEAK